MENTWYFFFIIVIALFVIYLPEKKRRRVVANRIIAKKRNLDRNKKEKQVMKELAQRFIGKDIYVKLLEGNADGIAKEVTENGIVLEKDGNIQVINLDYVIKIREYPYKKGKRATIWNE